MTDNVQVYQGSCHCEAIKFEIKTDLSVVVRCDCSLCRRKNALMTYPELSNFELKQGAEHLSVYQFNTQSAEHYFCKHCGIYTHHVPRTLPGKMGVNVSCLIDVDPNNSEVMEVSGSKFS